MTTEIIKVGLVGLIVCTDESDEEAERSANRLTPTGISSGWQVAGDEPGNPSQLPCAEIAGRRHLRMEC